MRFCSPLSYGQTAAFLHLSFGKHELRMVESIAGVKLFVSSLAATILAKIPGTLCVFLIWTEHSPPSSPLPMLVTERSTCGNGKSFRVQ